jgi:glycopeptide antibiotics resistance protein
MTRRRLRLVAGVTYVVVLLLLVTTPISWVLNRLTVRLYVVGFYDLHQHWLLPEHVGFLLNVLLFVPFGALVVLIARWPWWEAALLATGVSAAIEVVQYMPVLHRDASFADVICNGLGALLGAMAAAAVAQRRKYRHQRG